MELVIDAGHEVDGHVVGRVPVVDRDVPALGRADVVPPEGRQEQQVAWAQLHVHLAPDFSEPGVLRVVRAEEVDGTVVGRLEAALLLGEVRNVDQTALRRRDQDELLRAHDLAEEVVAAVGVREADRACEALSKMLKAAYFS